MRTYNLDGLLLDVALVFNGVNLLLGSVRVFYLLLLIVVLVLIEHINLVVLNVVPAKGL